MSALVERLLQTALDHLAEVAHDPPPLRVGKHLVAKVHSHEWSNGTTIAVRPPTPGALPIGIIWKEP